MDQNYKLADKGLLQILVVLEKQVSYLEIDGLTYAQRFIKDAAKESCISVTQAKHSKNYIRATSH